MAKTGVSLPKDDHGGRVDRGKITCALTCPHRSNGNPPSTRKKIYNSYSLFEKKNIFIIEKVFWCHCLVDLNSEIE